MVPYNAPFKTMGPGTFGSKIALYSSPRLMPESRRSLVSRSRAKSVDSRVLGFRKLAIRAESAPDAPAFAKFPKVVMWLGFRCFISVEIAPRISVVGMPSSNDDQVARISSGAFCVLSLVVSSDMRTFSAVSVEMLRNCSRV